MFKEEEIMDRNGIWQQRDYTFHIIHDLIKYSSQASTLKEKQS